MKFELATRTVDCGLAHSSVRIPYKIMGNEAHNVASKVVNAKRDVLRK